MGLLIYIITGWSSKKQDSSRENFCADPKKTYAPFSFSECDFYLRVSKTILKTCILNQIIIKTLETC